jgi:hypothetical protein
MEDLKVKVKNMSPEERAIADKCMRRGLIHAAVGATLSTTAFVMFST